MPTSGRFSWHDGLLFRVAFLPRGASVRSGPSFPCMALVDTGARRTCIGNAVVEALSLSPSREGLRLRTAGGVVDTALYDLRVVILDDDGSWGRAVNLTAPHIPGIGDAYRAIIGRDVLSLGDLTLERSGSYSFRY